MAKKLIEVALPLEEINKAAAREKSIRHGHPSTLHLWWARRPLAAARAVIFSSLITDPGDPEYPWQAGVEHNVEKERERLHKLITALVQWENSTNEHVLNQAREEILLHTDGNPPPLLDPFAGGGAIPLEAQRLGLEAHASDLNPVAVLINKAMIEIPPKFAGMPPVNPDQRSQPRVAWKGAAGLAEDVRYYGQWMRDEAERRIGHLYPKVQLPQEQGGGEATVIAWIWARTVTCPNPACGAEMPLVRSFILSKKKGKEAFVSPIVKEDRSGVDFETQMGRVPDSGTVGRQGARCLICETAVPLAHIRSEGKRNGLGQRLMAVVAEGNRGRLYVSPNPEHVLVANEAKPLWRPEVELPINPRDFKTPNYGLTTFGDLFTERQLVALTTFSDLVGEARERVLEDGLAAGRDADATRLADGGNGAAAYADAVATYLGFILGKQADLGNSLNRWEPNAECPRQLFARQAIPMVWDFAEGNPFSNSSGSWEILLRNACRVLKSDLFDTETLIPGLVQQADATHLAAEAPFLISTDPPYYDNIGYADLSDFFYVWHRRSLSEIWPDILRSLLVPKIEELVATPYRFPGGKQEAEKFFESGLNLSFSHFATMQNGGFPMSVYYAFKQAETESRGGKVASTGWETMLEGLVTSGWQITGTWPMNTEMATRMVGQGTNALASSIVLACRVRPAEAAEATRQQFIREMRTKLAGDLAPLRQANIAPVDLAQAAIGPGMAIYSQYSRVREASGDSLTVREALALINQVLDEVLAEQDEEYDPATRWAVSWYEQFMMNEGAYGQAETLAQARNVAVADLAHRGIVRSGQGKVRFIWREEYPEEDWHPHLDELADWVVMQRLARAVQKGQEAAARELHRIEQMASGRTELARDLAYRLYNIAERKGWNQEALVYNTLIQNWSALQDIAKNMFDSTTERQTGFDL